MAGDIKSGIGLGLFLAAVYGAIAVAVFVVSGGRAFTELGVPLPLVLVRLRFGRCLRSTI